MIFISYAEVLFMDEMKEFDLKNVMLLDYDVGINGSKGKVIYRDGIGFFVEDYALEDGDEITVFKDRRNPERCMVRYLNDGLLPDSAVPLVHKSVRLY